MANYEQSEDLLNMILVMGVTGAGKSYFINSLANGELAQTGARLNSCKLYEQDTLHEARG